MPYPTADCRDYYLRLADISAVLALRLGAVLGDGIDRLLFVIGQLD